MTASPHPLPPHLKWLASLSAPSSAAWLCSVLTTSSALAYFSAAMSFCTSRTLILSASSWAAARLLSRSPASSASLASAAAEV